MGIAQILAARAEGVQTVRMPVDIILPFRFQVRKTFELFKLEALADSIYTQTQLHPAYVRMTAENTAEMIAGERRLRAIRDILQVRYPQDERWRYIDAKPIQCTDDEAIDLHTDENIHQPGLLPSERATNARLLHDHGRTLDQIAKQMACSPKTVNTLLDIAAAPIELQLAIDQQQLRMSDFSTISRIPRREDQLRIADAIQREGWTPDEVIGRTQHLIPRPRKSSAAVAPATTNGRPTHAPELTPVSPASSEARNQEAPSLGAPVRKTALSSQDILERLGSITVDIRAFTQRGVWRATDKQRVEKSVGHLITALKEMLQEAEQ